MDGSTQESQALLCFRDEDSLIGERLYMHVLKVLSHERRLSARLGDDLVVDLGVEVLLPGSVEGERLLPVLLALLVLLRKRLFIRELEVVEQEYRDQERHRHDGKTGNDHDSLRVVLRRTDGESLRRAHWVLGRHAQRVAVCERFESLVLKRGESPRDLARQDVGPDGASDRRSDTTLFMSGIHEDTPDERLTAM